ncbi:MAG: transcription-repair coupling factor (superfamily II helicase), partial [Myxococcota bacterium]
MARRSPFDALVAAVDAAEAPVAITGVSGGFTALIAAGLQHAHGRTLVVVAPTRGRAREIYGGLRFFAGESVVLWTQADTSPYLPITPNRAVEMERVSTLFRLATRPPSIVVISARALAERTVPKSILERHSLTLRPGQDIERHDLTSQLEAAGYARVPVVEDPGTYAVRGGIVDVFSPVHAQPIRIDFFGDTIESLRLFDPQTQRGRTRTDELVISPVREILLTPETIATAKPKIRNEASELAIPSQQVRAILEELAEGMSPLGIESWLPAFYESPGTVADLIGPALWCVEDPSLVTAAITDLRAEAESQYADAVANKRICFPPDTLYADVSAVPSEAATHVQFLTLAYEEDLVGATHVKLKAKDHSDVRQKVSKGRGDDHAFAPLAKAIEDWRRRGYTVVGIADSQGHSERLRGLLRHYDLRVEAWETAFGFDQLEHIRTSPLDVNLMRGELTHGFVFAALKLVLLGTEDVLPHRQRTQRKSRASVKAAQSLQSFQELRPGAHVVHTDHGIGRYEGLVKLPVEGAEGDYLRLIYRGDDVLYVPVHVLDRVARYTAGEDAKPRLDKLGGVTWDKTKSRAKKAALSMAGELIKVAAAREARFRESYAPEDDYFEEFCASFPWDETPDQATAISDVMDDMNAEKPMDRLVCGDVGYGKTEVAMRAAFRAVLSGFQVAILVPTTVLAEQHRLTFEDRFRGYPVNIAALSRFRTKKEESRIIEQVTAGKLDIVIGTHRILSKDVAFKRLGLLIVDEEHRFGVRDKERIKKARELVDVLTLTATPIPRTLNMALSGLRTMSIIATPPTERLAVRTLVSRVSDEIIASAIDTELKRAGQVYFLHNRVSDIHLYAERIQRLVPRARVLVGHGQMKESELEKVMLRFMAGEADVLVCTTIIESGLDIPRANTMLIHRADKLGLAQLYQLRGRVGRSDRRAYCYLLIPEPRNLLGLAAKRVAAMQKFTELGSGFQIATMDMEIRGAGNLLGGGQSGHVKEIGLDLFC